MTMRCLAVVCSIAIGLSPVAASAAPQVSSIVYSLGGLMSGPYRVSADLAAATASEAKTPPGVFGDGARVSTASLPVTSTRPLAPGAVRKLDALASAVWKDGPDKPIVESRHYIGRRAVISFTPCQPSLDAQGRFDIVRHGVTHTFNFSTVCMNKTADELLTALTCDANPDNCPKPSAR